MAQIDLNQAQCIKSAEYIGRTEYHNICNSAVSIVHWGTVDWITAIFVCMLCVGAALIFIVLLIMMLLAILDA